MKNIIITGRSHLAIHSLVSTLKKTLTEHNVYDIDIGIAYEQMIQPCILISYEISRVSSKILNNINHSLVVNIDQMVELDGIVNKVNNSLKEVTKECVCSGFTLLHNGCECKVHS